MLGEHIAAEPDLQSETLFCEKPGCSPHCQLSAKLLSSSFPAWFLPRFFLKHTGFHNVHFCVTTSDFSHSLWRNEHQRVGLGLDFRKTPHTYIPRYPAPRAVPQVTLHQDFCRQVEIRNHTLVCRIWDRQILHACRCWLCRMNFSEHLQASKPTLSSCSKGNVKAQGLQLSGWYLVMPSWSAE